VSTGSELDSLAEVEALGFTRRAVVWPLVAGRAAVGLLMLAYLGIIVASHSIPLSPDLEIPLGVGGWLAFAIVLALIARRRGVIVVSIKPWPLILHLIFATMAGLTLYFAFSGNLPTDCKHGADSCLKIDNWRTSAGHYYRQYPYDSQGNDDAGAPWVEISRQLYVAEVGTRLRLSAQFGVGMLCVSWVLTSGLNAIRRADDS